jgi:hypothetical protein
LRIPDYAQRLLRLAEIVHGWLGALSALDQKRRLRMAAYADEIAATLARAGNALHRLGASSSDRATEIEAIRELGASAAISRPSSTCSSITLTDASSRALKGGPISFARGELRRCVVSGRKPIHIDRLASAEGYFRALADGLKT